MWFCKKFLQVWVMKLVWLQKMVKVGGVVFIWVMKYIFSGLLWKFGMCCFICQIFSQWLSLLVLMCDCYFLQSFIVLVSMLWMLQLLMVEVQMCGVKLMWCSFWLRFFLVFLSLVLGMRFYLLIIMMIGLLLLQVRFVSLSLWLLMLVVLIISQIMLLCLMVVCEC